MLLEFVCPLLTFTQGNTQLALLAAQPSLGKKMDFVPCIVLMLYQKSVSALVRAYISVWFH